MADRDDSRPGEDELRARVVLALERLVVAVESDSADKPQPVTGKARWLTPTTVSVFLSAVTIAVTIWYSQGQLTKSSEQFERTMRQDQYSDIVSGMASSSVGVQVNSLRRLVQYVVEPANFDDNSLLQQQAAANTAQTLAAFIEDESSVPGHEGLTDFRDPQPVVVSRALDQLVELTGLKDGGEEEDERDRRFPTVDVDFSRGNFHGVYAPDFAPEGAFLATAADFRSATLTGWDLTAVRSPSLSSAFFTCADLQTSDLGRSDVSGADFTGANLRGANLSQVENLTTEQITGALVGEQTRLPIGVEAPPQPGWGIVQDDGNFRPSPACRHLMDRMTNLLAGGGFSSRLPCPSSDSSAWVIRLAQTEQSALDRTCRLRTLLDRTNRQQSIN